MKAKIIITGEIVKVSYVTGLRDDDSLCNASVRDIEIIDDNTDKAIDWEQRRYEIAKDVLVGLVSAHQSGLTDATDSLEAIKHADELIKQLKSNQS